MNNKFKPVIVLVLICVIASAALAYANEVTKGAIAEQNAKSEAEALQAVMPDVSTVALTEDEVNAVVAKLTFEDQKIVAVYKAEKDGAFVGYIFNTTAKGYGGDISVITGIGADKKITGVKVISHKETAGLGAKAAVNGEGSFVSQYGGKTPGALTVIKTSGAGEDEIDAITSATKTSRAVTRAVNIAGNAFDLLGGEAK